MPTRRRLRSPAYLDAGVVIQPPAWCPASGLHACWVKGRPEAGCPAYVAHTGEGPEVMLWCRDAERWQEWAASREEQAPDDWPPAA